VIRDAEISDDEVYRYVLNRRWNQGLPVMPWVLLNPSTADAEVDDPTVGRMMTFADRERCGGICVLNLYALRSPNPRWLRAHPDPVGPDNDKWLAGLASDAAGGPPVMAAWGAHPLALPRLPRVRELLGGLPMTCLGVTRNGSPAHPLYLRSSTQAVTWEWPGAA